MVRLPLALMLASAACLPYQMPSSTSPGLSTPATIQAPIIPKDTFETLKPPADAHAELCANDGAHPRFPDDADRLTRVFCQDQKPGGVMPTPHSLAELQKILGLDFKNPRGGNGTDGNPGFALLAHSSALTARKVSSITPTAFIFTPPITSTTATVAGTLQPVSDFLFLAFDPGEQFVEIAAEDPTAKVVNFYLLMFEQECNSAPGGCTNADLLTDKLVTNWTSVRIYESSTYLNNTIADCRQCHAANGDGNPLILRMQEIIPPFTHWMSTKTQGGQELLKDFYAAHGADEDYGPIPAAMVGRTDPAKMAELIQLAGFGNQPNEFDSQVIEAEVNTECPGQPSTNVPAGESQTWNRIYDRAVAGQFILPPYHDVKVTDPGKLTKMTSAYQAWRAGKSKDLPDIRDVFLDSGLPDMGFAGKPGLDGYGLLVQMCQQCHNANLDMTITRERFLVDRLDQMSRQEKDLAITRLNTSTDSRLVMPPTLFRTITDEERKLMIQELQK